MISMAVLAARTKTPASLIPKTFGRRGRFATVQPHFVQADLFQGPEQIHVPKAPALGLLLEQPRFKTYNDNMLLKSKQNNVEHNHPVRLPLLTPSSPRCLPIKPFWNDSSNSRHTKTRSLRSSSSTSTSG